MKKRTPISEINKNWVKKKHTYEKGHRYAGSPDLIINRLNVPLIKEDSSDIKRMRN